MTYTEIVSMLESIGLPLAYHHFEEGESPEPPFLIFIFRTPTTSVQTTRSIRRCRSWTSSSTPMQRILL